MEEKVKQRLIGGIVIVGALFIILPFLFHNSRPSAETKLSSNIPNPSSTVTLALPAATTSTPNTKIADNTAQTPDAASTTSTATTTTTAETPSNTTEAQTPTTTETTSNTTETTSNTTEAQTPAATETTSNATEAQPDAATTPSTTEAQTPAATTTSTTTTTTSSTKPSSKKTTNVTTALAGNSFTQSPGALTNGQSNEGVVQPAVSPEANAQQPNAQQPNASLASAQPVNKPVVVNQEAARLAAKRLALKREERARAKLAMHAQGAQGAWVIQLGVFSDRDNAKRLVSELRKNHFQAYSRDVKLADNRFRLMAVFVGPEINYQTAEMLKSRLRHEFHLNGEVKKYEA